MGRDERQLRRMRGEALSRLLQGLTYGGCLVIFYALMAIPNWPLRNLSRTSATTLVTWVAMGAAMLAVFNAVTVGIGELISCTILGVALVKLIESNAGLNKIFTEE